ncbi:phage tail tip lysozyme, partial [Enterococcus faecalis]
MKILGKVLIVSCFIFILPFLLFLAVFSSSENGDSSQFQPATPQEKVALEVLNFVTSNGGTMQFAAAWIGNMEHESGLNPARIQSDLTFNSAIAYNPSLGGYGIGLGQW